MSVSLVVSPKSMHKVEGQLQDYIIKEIPILVELWGFILHIRFFALLWSIVLTVT